MTYRDYDGGNPATVTCGAYDSGTPANQTLLTSDASTMAVGFTLYTDKTTGGLEGITVSSIPVLGGISYPQYLDWIFQGGSAWTIGGFTKTDFPDGTIVPTIGGDTYFNQQLALYSNNAAYPVVDTVTIYEDSAGLCLGFSAMYENYPGVTYKYYSSIATADSTKTVTKTFATGETLTALTASADTVNGSYIALQFTDGVTNVDCGNFNTVTNTAVNGGETSSTPNGFYAAFDATTNHITGISVYTIEYNTLTDQLSLRSHAFS